MNSYRYCLSIGSNLGDKPENIRLALLFLKNSPSSLIGSSAIYSSEALGYESKNTFLNACVYVESTLSPLDFLRHLKNYEIIAGRSQEKTLTYADRIIDLDILLCGQMILETESLIIPHPEMHKRNFVLVPLSEICGELVHPIFNKTVIKLREICEDKSKIEIINAKPFTI